MKNISMIACVSRDLGLGNKGGLLWRIPEDIQFFRQTTLGHPVVMGGATYRSIGKALPERQNIVLSRSEIDDPNVKCLHSLNRLEDYLEKLADEVFIIGGASLYETFLPRANRLVLTEVDGVRPADVFFPKFDPADFRARTLESGEAEGVKYCIMEYIRKVPHES